MSLTDLLPLCWRAVDLAGSLILAGFVAAALPGLLRGRGVVATRLVVADGAVLALSIKTAASLLKTIELRTWEQLAAFTAILGLRILLKRLFVWERARLHPSGAPFTTALTSAPPPL